MCLLALSIMGSLGTVQAAEFRVSLIDNADKQAVANARINAFVVDAQGREKVTHNNTDETGLVVFDLPEPEEGSHYLFRTKAFNETRLWSEPVTASGEVLFVAGDKVIQVKHALDNTILPDIQIKAKQIKNNGNPNNRAIATSTTDNDGFARFNLPDHANGYVFELNSPSSELTLFSTVTNASGREELLVDDTYATLLPIREFNFDDDLEDGISENEFPEAGIPENDVSKDTNTDNVSNPAALSGTFYLIDAEAGNSGSSIIKNALVSGQVLKYDTFPEQFSFSFEFASGGSNVACTQVSSEGALNQNRTESVSPYTLFGDIDSRGEYFVEDKTVLQEGDLTLSILAFDGRRCTGNVVFNQSLDINIAMSDSSGSPDDPPEDPAPPADPSPDPEPPEDSDPGDTRNPGEETDPSGFSGRFYLIDAQAGNNNNAIIKHPVTAQDSFDYDTFPEQFSFSYEFSNVGSNIACTQVSAEGALDHTQTESVSPYTLFGDVDSRGEYFVENKTALQKGDLTLSIVAFDGGGCTGNVVFNESLNINIAKSDNSGSPNDPPDDPAPPADPSPDPEPPEEPDPGEDPVPTELSGTFYLIDAQSGNTASSIVKRNLTNGDTFDYQIFPEEFNFSFEFSNQENGATCTQISAQGALNHNRTEGVSPYALFGDMDAGAEYFVENKSQLNGGPLTLTVSAYANNGCNGALLFSDSLTININKAGDSTPPVSPEPDTTFISKNGLVVMETESTHSALQEWQEETQIAGFSGDSYLKFNGNTPINGPANSPLSYPFSVTEPGLYYLHLRMAKQHVDGRTDLANDVYVRLDGNVNACPGAEERHGANATLNHLTNDTKFFGGEHNRFVWASGNHLDAGGEHNKRIACYQLFAGEDYNLVVSGRSQLTKIDRIVFRHESISRNVAEDLSLTETQNTHNCAISGDLKQWHRTELTCTGYQADENNDATFTDVRFDVTFTHNSSGVTMVVPGHFAADGNAGNTSASSGNKWRTYFMPTLSGNWQYEVAFRTGNNLAVSTNPGQGQPQAFHGLTGTFEVTATAPNNDVATDPDMRLRGLLTLKDGESYLSFDGTNSYFFEGGMDSPENLFGYSEFDNTTKNFNVGSCKGILHEFAPHVSDWQTGDPTWKSGSGKSLIGLINYITSTGVNGIYINFNTKNGDGCDAHPWSEYFTDFKNFDVSKLDQWEVTLSHMTKKGLLIHVLTQETENDQMLNNGDLGIERKLYYRELISRFGHHPALQWNLGEENTNNVSQIMAFANFIRDLDPYGHAIVMHTYPGQYYRYDDLLGFENFDGPTFQIGGIPSNDTNTNSVYSLVRRYLAASASKGKTWFATFTEASGGDAPTPFSDVTRKQRVFYMYATMMAGGAGFEWYLKNNGSGHAYDLSVENMREFDAHWQQTGHAVRFFRDTLQGQFAVNPQSLTIMNELTPTNDDWVLAQPGTAYLVYLRDGDDTTIDLSGDGQYQTWWFNPENGNLAKGSDLVGMPGQNLGIAPNRASNEDALVLIVRQ